MPMWRFGTVPGSQIARVAPAVAVVQRGKPAVPDCDPRDILGHAVVARPRYRCLWQKCRRAWLAYRRSSGTARCYATEPDHAERGDGQYLSHLTRFNE